MRHQCVKKSQSVSLSMHILSGICFCSLFLITKEGSTLTSTLISAFCSAHKTLHTYLI